jgi:hypothetical protein
VAAVRRARRLYVASALVVGLAVFAAAGVKVYLDRSDGPDAKASGALETWDEYCSSSRGMNTPTCVEPTICSMMRWPEGSTWREGVEVPCTPENEEWARNEQGRQTEQAEEILPCRARCQEAARRVPQRTNESCLYRHGRIRWCLTVPEGEEWYIVQYAGREHRGRYFLENHKNEVQGYLRPTSYGYRAMVGVCGLDGPNNCGWARGGKVVRTGQRNALRVYSNTSDREDADGSIHEYKASTIEVARGPNAIEVAAFRLIYGDCRYAWTEEPLTWKPCRNGAGQ